MRAQKKQFEDDDGRVICDMNVAGMPWYDRTVRPQEHEARRKLSQNSGLSGDAMTNSEARRYTYYAVLAGLTVVAVFAVAWILLTLFMTQIWFR